MLKKWSRINSYSCDANRELQTVISPKLIKIFSFCFVLLIFSCTFMWTQKYSINKQLILCAGTYYKAQASPLLDLLVPPIIVPKSVTSHLKQLIMVKDINHILPLIVSLICGVFKSTVTGEMVFFYRGGAISLNFLPQFPSFTSHPRVQNSKISWSCSWAHFS